ncbi:MAG: synthase family protein [Pseudonocardiales bacterium]|nr:synthase family protein [Pseudonocardiales bacterium]
MSVEPAEVSGTVRPLGPRVLIVQIDPADPPGRLRDWLTDAGAQVAIWDVRTGLRADVDDVEAIVVLGGYSSANDSDAVAPWLAPVRAAIGVARERDLPLLCIGLGAHLLAVAAGGRVEIGDEGPEYGAQLVAKRTTAAADPLLREVPITPDVVQWHRDAVTALPPGAILLASSPSYDNQAFRIGRLAWGFQFHIEATREILARWAGDDAEVSEQWDVERLLDRLTAVEDDLAETWAPVAAAFVEVARDPAAVDAQPAVTVSTAGPIMDPAQIRAALAAEAHATRGGPVPLALPTFRPSP